LNDVKKFECVIYQHDNKQILKNNAKTVDLQLFLDKIKYRLLIRFYWERK